MSGQGAATPPIDPMTESKKPMQRDLRRGPKRLEDPKMAGRLLRLGILVLLSSFALDVASSWVMMTLFGVSAEGNATMKLLFQERTGQTLVVWLAGQYSWFLFLLLGLLGLLFADLHQRLRGGLARSVVSLTYRVVVIYGVVFTWGPGVLRFVKEVGSNTAGLLFPFGPLAQIGRALTVVTAGTLVIVRDFGRQLSPGRVGESN